MLVRFMLKNVLSFREETVLDMTAISAYKEHEGNLIDIGAKEKYVRTAAIYGANASGKSNLFLAMCNFRNIIQESANNPDHELAFRKGEVVPAIAEYYKPFLFEKENHDDSEFEITTIINGFEYRYGFSYNATAISEEWLYRKSLETNRTTTIFERAADEIEFGPSVKKECDVYKDQVPSDALVLSFFNRLKLETDAFEEAYHSIINIGAFPSTFYDDVHESLNEYLLVRAIDKNKAKLMEFLSAIDTGIKDIGYKKRGKKFEFVTYHVDTNGEKYPLLLDNESEGTQKSIIIFIIVFLALQADGTLFTDELNTKLHPLLLKFVVDLFYAEDSQAQLIYTTHDTTLMDKKFFRRDQLWFVQKDEHGYSELTALSDFKVRSDSSFEKDYLAGVYGGIPFLKEFSMQEGEGE